MYNNRERDFSRNIRRAKTNAWERFCEMLNDDPWGKPYKVVMKALKVYKGPAKVPDNTVRRAVAELFITHEMEGDSQLTSAINALADEESRGWKEKI